MAKKKFVFEFDDESAAASGKRHDGMTFECDGEETLSLEEYNGQRFLFANRSGMVTLAKILLKFGLSEYKSGFHIHIYKNFNADEPKQYVSVLAIVRQLRNRKGAIARAFRETGNQ